MPKEVKRAIFIAYRWNGRELIPPHSTELVENIRSTDQSGKSISLIFSEGAFIDSLTFLLSNNPACKEMSPSYSLGW